MSPSCLIDSPVRWDVLLALHPSQPTGLTKVNARPGKRGVKATVLLEGLAAETGRGLQE